MKRGEVWWVDFDPSIGGEARKIRPAVIVSNDSSNRHLNRLQVVPTTSNVGKLFPSETMVFIDGKHSKAQCDMLTTVSKLRVLRKLGEVSGKEMRAIERGIKTQLSLP